MLKNFHDEIEKSVKLAFFFRSSVVCCDRHGMLRSAGEDISEVTVKEGEDTSEQITEEEVHISE